MKLIGDDRKIPDFTNPKENKPLDTARLIGVLQLAAEKAGWGKPLPKGVARGIAGYFSFESYTAAVAEVSVKDKQVHVQRIVYAVDCGRPVNPNGIAAQVEGAAIYGLSAVMKDAITIKVRHPATQRAIEVRLKSRIVAGIHDIVSVDVSDKRNVRHPRPTGGAGCSRRH